MVRFCGRGLKDRTWKGRVPSSPCWSMLPSIEGVSAAISSSSGPVLVRGQRLFNLVRCVVSNGVGRMMLDDYRVVLSEGRTFVGVVGQLNFP